MRKILVVTLFFAASTGAGTLVDQGMAGTQGWRVSASLGTAALSIKGAVAHDAAATAIFPALFGGYASAAAPSDVSADLDAVRAWFLRNGAQAMVLTAGGALLGGDAANGLDVDVTRLSALVTGSAIIGRVGIDQTTPGTTNRVDVGTFPDNEPFNLAQIGGASTATGGGVEAGSLRVTMASDSTGVLSIDDNGGSLTIDSAQLPAALVGGRLDVVIGAELPAGTQNIGDVDVVTLPSVTIGTFPDNEPFNAAQWGGTAVAGGLGIATAGSPRVVLATDVALPAGTNAIGKLAANSGVDIGDVDVASIAAGANVIGKVGIDQTTPGTTNLVQITDGAGALNTIVDSGTLTAVTTITNPVTVTDGAGALNVIVDSSALPTGAATEATLAAASAKLPAVLGQTTMAASLSVTVASNQSAVTVTDGAGAMNVIVDSITAGDNNIGNVDIVTMPSVTIGTFPDNEPFNLAQIGGVAVATGEGVATNALRAVLANDAPLPTGDNVIGYINGSGVAGTPNAGVMTVQGITGATAVTVTQPVGWKAPAACVVGAGAAAQAADFAVLAAVANTRLCMLQVRDTGAGTAAGIVRHAAYGANCNTGNVIGYFALGANAVYNVITGSRDLAVALGVCVDVTAGTVDASWASVVEAAP